MHLLMSKKPAEKIKLQRSCRIRLNHELCLIEQFNINPIWDYETTIVLAAKIGVPANAVRKWNWNYRK